jgi:DNA-directed RNA polymerase subunit RPC12/RpoP
MATRKTKPKAKRPDEYNPFSVEVDPKNPPAGPACPTCGSVDTYVIPYGLDASGYGHDAITGNEPRYWCRPCEKGWGRLADVKPRPPCPKCGSARVRPIVYGEPTAETFERARYGGVSIGGCMCWGDERDHKWECLDCEHRFGGIDAESR